MIRDFLLILLALLLISCAGDKKVEEKSDGLHVYKVRGFYGYYGTLEGKDAKIEPQFQYARDFSEGLAVVGSDRKYGYINEKAKLVIPIEFDMAYDFSENLAKVMLKGKFGFVDKSGKVVIDCKFDNASDFHHGFAKVLIEGEYRIIDQSGKFVILQETNIQFIYRPKNF